VSNQLQGPTPEALVDGFRVAYIWSAAILAVAGIIWVVLVRMTKEDMQAHDADAAVPML